MALLWMDGFDHYNNPDSDSSTKLAKAYTVSNSNSIQCVAGRYGAAAAWFAPGSGSLTKIYKSITPNVGATHLIVGFNFIYFPSTRIYINSGGNYTSFYGLMIVNNLLYVANTHVTTLTANTWYHMEWRLPISTSGGNKYEFYLNGATIFSSDSANAQWSNGLHFTAYWNDVGAYYFGLDDLYVMDNTGTTNNTRIGSELYVPRIETQFPVDDVTNNFTPSYTPITTVNDGFESLGSGVNGTTLLSYLETTFGFNNFATLGSFQVASGDGGDRTGSRSLIITQVSSTKSYIEFNTIASSISFYVSAYYTSNYPTQLAITINGTTTNTTINNNYGQTNWVLITLTLDSTKVNRVKIGHGANSVNLSGIKIDDVSVVYTSKNAAQLLFKIPETSAYLQSSTNGNKIIGNISNLTTINDVKAVGFYPIASESITATTSSYKILANNGGSDTEIGSTQSVTGTTTARSAQLFDVNPLTSTTWTASDFNAIKAGIINKT